RQLLSRRRPAPPGPGRATAEGVVHAPPGGGAMEPADDGDLRVADHAGMDRAQVLEPELDQAANVAGTLRVPSKSGTRSVPTTKAASGEQRHDTVVHQTETGPPADARAPARSRLGRRASRRHRAGLVARGDAHRLGR